MVMGVRGGSSEEGGVMDGDSVIKVNERLGDGIEGEEEGGIGKDNGDDRFNSCVGGIIVSGLSVRDN